MTFGVTTAGFVRKTALDVQTELQDGYVAAFGNVQTDAASVNGNKIAIHGDQVGKVWEILEQSYDAGFIDSATDSQLDRFGAFINRARLAPSYSVVDLILEGTPGTVIAVGSTVSDGLIDWSLLTSITIDTSGSTSAQASPASVGPTIALAGSITTIKSAVSGWLTVRNPTDAVPGRAVEGATSYRRRLKGAFRTGDSAAAQALQASLLRISDVSEAVIIENRSDFVVDTRPAHSFEAVVRGGSDADIILVLYAQAAAGGQQLGTRQYDITDRFGNPQTVRFSRPTERSVYLTVTYATRGTFPSDGEASMRSIVLAYGNALLLGQDVVPIEIIQSIETLGLHSLSISAGFTAVGQSTEPLSLALNELARFDSSRLAFVRSA